MNAEVDISFHWIDMIHGMGTHRANHQGLVARALNAPRTLLFHALFAPINNDRSGPPFQPIGNAKKNRCCSMVRERNEASNIFSVLLFVAAAFERRKRKFQSLSRERLICELSSPGRKKGRSTKILMQSNRETHRGETSKCSLRWKSLSESREN